jgi:hypothetical protein
VVIDRSALPTDADLLLNPSPAASLFPGLGQDGDVGLKRCTTTFLDRTHGAVDDAESLRLRHRMASLGVLPAATFRS